MKDELKKISLNVKKAVDEELEKNYESVGEILKIGADGTPTSRLDLVAENQVFEYVEDHDLPFNILSEEYGFLNRGYDETLVVDPLDGSYNAENNIPIYSISLAIGKKTLNDIRFGFVMNLANGKYYWAEKGKGSFFEERRMLRKKRNEKLGVISIGKNVKNYVFEIMKNVSRIRSLGCASLEMIMVAEGNADFFIYDYEKKGVLRIIDIGASTLIVRENGGKVIDSNNFSDLEMDFDLMQRRNIIAYYDPSDFDLIKGWRK